MAAEILHFQTASPNHGLMFDGVEHSLQRVRGAARVGFGPCNGLVDLFQKGSAKAMLPKTHSGTPEVVFLNTAGGLTGGDHLTYGLDLAPDTHVTAATQTAERAYASTTGAARVELKFTVGAGARLDWLPQDTILYDGSALRRTTEIDLADGASCLFCEMLTLGRAAMGETVTEIDVMDRRRITRNGVPVFVDPVRLDTPDLSAPGVAGLSGAKALATIGYIAEDAEDRLQPLRRFLPEGVAASAWDGKLIIRALSPDPYGLRRAMGAILEHLRGAALPRVWQI